MTDRPWSGPHWLRPQEPNEETAHCKADSCQMPIVWRKSPISDKSAPVDINGGSHFATCGEADTFRKRGHRSDIDG